ncbi:unnamed protein product, partial [Effrenium voratum]
MSDGSGPGRTRRARSLEEMGEGNGKGSSSSRSGPLIVEVVEPEPTMVVRPDGVVEAEASAQWPGGPEGEPSALVPLRGALFTPEQMKRLDEWTEEAPLISQGPGGGNQRGFENYLERANEGMIAIHDTSYGGLEITKEVRELIKGTVGLMDIMEDIKYFMMQLMADNQSLRKEMQRCVRRVDEIQREAPAAGKTSADQSDKFATPEEKGTPVGGGDQLRLQN